MGEPQIIRTPGGEELAILPRAELDEMRDELAHLRARHMARPSDALTAEAMRQLLAAASPLAFWRERRGLSVEELSQRSGVSVARIAGIEAGATAGLGDFRRLADALGLDIDDIAPM